MDCIGKFFDQCAKVLRSVRYRLLARALVRQVAAEPAAPEPQMSQAQMLRLQLAQAAQERRAQAHMRMVAPIRQFYGL